MTVSRSTMTRVLHLLLLVAVIHQLVSSLLLEWPRDGAAPGLLWRTHQYLGVAALSVVFALWLWTLVRHRETPLGALVPWFSGLRLRALGTDIAKYGRNIVRGKLVDDRDSAFAEMVHGLGLLLVTAMAVTGTVWLLAPDGSQFGYLSIRIHSLLHVLMWAYLAAHAGLAVLHHLLGSDVLSRMFLRHRTPPQAPAE